MNGTAKFPAGLTLDTLVQPTKTSILSKFLCYGAYAISLLASRILVMLRLYWGFRGTPPVIGYPTTQIDLIQGKISYWTLLCRKLCSIARSSPSSNVE